MHTQGPWIVAPSSNKGNGSDWRDIHSIGEEFSPSYVGEALEQDAQLIAAAPDLLKALERIAAGQEMTDAYGLADVITRYQRIAMDAIAKATNANPRR
jgi:hypothetical protein